MATNILTKANEIVNGARQNDYGHPAINHERTADLLNSYLRGKYGELTANNGVPFKLTSIDVCFINILQKISRDMNAPTVDNLVDIAGYAQNVMMIREYGEETAPQESLENISNDTYTLVCRQCWGAHESINGFDTTCGSCRESNIKLGLKDKVWTHCMNCGEGYFGLYNSDYCQECEGNLI